jgi:hypothetical protein
MSRCLIGDTIICFGKVILPGQYLERFNDLDLIREERIKYLHSENVDSMFMLRKKG